MIKSILEKVLMYVLQEHENYFEFLLSVSSQFSVVEQLMSAADVITYIATLPDDRDDGMYYRNMRITLSSY